METTKQKLTWDICEDEYDEDDEEVIERARRRSFGKNEPTEFILVLKEVRHVLYYKEEIFRWSRGEEEENKEDIEREKEEVSNYVRRWCLF